MSKTYALAQGNGKTSMSFLSTYLLDCPRPFKVNYGTQSWEISPVRTWLKDRVFNGINLQWKTLLKEARLNTYHYNGSNFATLTTKDMVFLPAESYFIFTESKAAIEGR